MANTVLVKRSAVAAKVPTTSDLALGEIGINTYDGKMYIKKDNGAASIVELLSTASVVAVANGGTGSTTAAGAATNLGLGTGDSPQFTAVNIGHATDTTITRSAAGVIAVEGGVIPKENRANTFSATQYITAGNHLIVGSGGGSVALTLNDGYGNANVAFNHVGGTPDQSGSSGRIVVAVDSTSAYMGFKLGDSVTSGVAVGLTEVFGLSKTSVFIRPNGTETFRFGSNGSLSIGSSGTGYGTAGQFMKSNGNAAPSWSNVASVTIYTSGSGNYTVPAGCKAIFVRMWGAGGGGAHYVSGVSSAGGGGGGLYIERMIDASTLGATVAYAVGAGGPGGTGATRNGTRGGNTTFGSLTAYGGGAGGTTDSGAGSGFFGTTGYGSTTTADALWPFTGGSGNAAPTVGGAAQYGGAGGGGYNQTSGGYSNGGTSVYGGNGGNGAATNGGAGSAPGGGGGGSNGAGTGGTGGAGRIEIYAW